MNTDPFTQQADHMKVLVVDREPRAASLLEEHCRALLSHRLEQLTTADSVRTALARLGETAYDLVLLDPQLERNDGLDLLSPQTTAQAFQTIIVSARTDLAMRAFDHGVLDFVPKPVDRERLSQALRRFPRQLKPAAPPGRFLAVRRLGRIDLVAVDDLLYVEGADKYSELVLASGQRSLHDKCLGRLEASLTPAFVRIHKSFLVRFALVSRLVVLKGSRYFAELKNGVRLPVGRSRYEQIKALLI